MLYVNNTGSINDNFNLSTVGAPAGTAARRTAWIAQAAGSTMTAASSGRSSGTAWSWLAWATIIPLHPPPVDAQ